MHEQTQAISDKAYTQIQDSTQEKGNLSGLVERKETGEVIILKILSFQMFLWMNSSKLSKNKIPRNMYTCWKHRKIERYPIYFTRLT